MQEFEQSLLSQLQSLQQASSRPLHLVIPQRQQQQDNQHRFLTVETAQQPKQHRR